MKCTGAGSPVAGKRRILARVNWRRDPPRRVNKSGGNYPPQDRILPTVIPRLLNLGCALLSPLAPARAGGVVPPSRLSLAGRLPEPIGRMGMPAAQSIATFQGSAAVRGARILTVEPPTDSGRFV